MALLKLLTQLAAIACVATTFAHASVNVEARRPIGPRESSSKYDELARRLSPKASIAYSVLPRWSAYAAPTPGATVNVATDKDVQVTVQYCVRKNIPFLAQGGGHGSSTSLNLGRDGIVINLRGLNATSVSGDGTRLRAGGGALTGEVVAAAAARGAQVVLGSCDCVGTLGSTLGGGFSRLTGLRGLAVDNLLGADVVLADGSAVTVGPKDKDLWFALRGAGANFGVVTGVTYRAYPTPPAENVGWTGALVFTPDKLEPLVTALGNLELKPEMMFLMLFGAAPAPAIIVQPFYRGRAAQGKAAFASVYAVGPVQDATSERPFDKWNEGIPGICDKGLRRPLSGAGFTSLRPATWRRLWNAYADFVRLNGTQASTLILEAYPLRKAQALDDGSASFPHRDVRFEGFANPTYADPALDAEAQKLCEFTRRTLRADGPTPPATYVNFATGDESNEVIYGRSLPRLRTLKRRYDPENVFNHWFNIRA